jgi:LmbE family N-acetylglucosaminyl deacetylase
MSVIGLRAQASDMRGESGPVAHLLDDLARRQPARICVVSPHLDDAALSVWTLLSSAWASRCRVVTVFTSARPDSNPTWARQTGFRDALHEVEVRRDEDSRAMTRLGVRFEHAGREPDRWDADAATRLAQELLDGADPAIDGDTLVLLPAGAGQPTGSGQRLWRRLTRTPTGPDAHDEHLAVRDLLGFALRAAGVRRLGYYAEIPYMWSDTPQRLSDEVDRVAGVKLHLLAARPDADRKLALVAEYASQMDLICGRSTAYRRRLLGREELYFLSPAG